MSGDALDPYADLVRLVGLCAVLWILLRLAGWIAGLFVP